MTVVRVEAVGGLFVGSKTESFASLPKCEVLKSLVTRFIAKAWRSGTEELDGEKVDERDGERGDINVCFETSWFSGQLQVNAGLSFSVKKI